MGFEYDILDIGDAFEVSAAAHHELGLSQLDNAPAHVHVCGTDRVTHARQRYIEGPQPLRIHHDGILPHKPADTGDFRLLSRRAVNALGRLRERQRFMKGLFAWVGFRQLALDYARDPRHAGRSSFNYWRLWNFAIEGFTSFSTLPLRLATYVGVVTALLAFVGGAWVVIKTLLWGDPVAGYPSLMVVVLMLGGIQLMALGIAGEYLGWLYMEVKGRPLYLIQERCGVSTGGPDATARAEAVDSVNERATS